MRVVTAKDTAVKGRPGHRASKARSGAEAGRPAPLERTPFAEILEEILPPAEGDSEDLHRLWSDLPQTERNLLDSPSAKNFSAYRDLVKKIAIATLQKNTRLRSMSRKGSKGQDLKLQVVEFIDERLQKMATMMHSPRNSAFALLRKFEEIRGLLMDVRQ